MKHFFSTVLFTLLVIINPLTLSAQCIATVGVYNYTASSGSVGSPQAIFSCNWPGDYNTVTVPAGIWKFGTSNSADFITITSLGNVVIDTGTSSVTIGFLTSQTVRMHIFTNSSCGTSTICRNAYVQEEVVPVPNVSANDTFICDGFGPVTLTANNAFGDQTYWYAGSCGSTPIDSGISISVPITSTTTYYSANYFNGSLSTCGSLTVNIVSNPIVSIASSQDVLCFGDSTGSISASASTGTLPYTYTWSNGMIGSTIDSLSIGNYTVTVIDAYGCIDSTSSLIDEPSELTSNTTVLIVPACAGQATGSIGVTAAGGFGTYSYLWSNNDTSSIADSLDAGVHQVTITDENNCQITAVDTIVAPSVVSISLVSILDSVACFGDLTGEIVVTASGGSGNLDYEWSTSLLDSAITGLGSGIYTVTVTDQNGCNDVYTDTIYSPEELTVSFTVTNATCHNFSDGEILAEGFGGTAPYSFSWSNGNSGALISGIDTGIYSVTITDMNNCNTEAVETILFSNPDPIVILDSSYTFCTGFEIILDAENTGSNFIWSTGETSQTITVSDSGMYSVTVVDANGCDGEGATFVVEEDCLGIDELGLNGSIDLFPNPTRGNVNILFDVQGINSINYTLYSIEGRPLIIDRVNLANGKGTAELNLSTYSSGIYFITFASEGKTQTQRIILQ